MLGLDVTTKEMKRLLLDLEKMVAELEAEKGLLIQTNREFLSSVNGKRRSGGCVGDMLLSEVPPM